MVISEDGLIKSRYLFSRGSTFMEQLSFSLSVLTLLGKYFKNNFFCFSSFLLNCLVSFITSILFWFSGLGSSFLSSLDSSFLSSSSLSSLLLILFSFDEESFLFF